MTASRRKGDSDKSPPPSTGKADDPLLTSQDLFGDMIDAPLADEDAAGTAEAERKEPIRIRISDPEGKAGTGSPRPKGGAPLEMQQADDDEVAALLDVLSPAAPKAPKTPAPAQREVDALEDDLVKSRTSTKFSATPPQAPEVPAVDLAAIAAEGMAASALSEKEVLVKTGRTVHKVYGPYHLLERVAVGGMAEVFRATRSGVEGFEKVVAVKRILAHLSDNKEFVDMFINEAKMVAGLTHPNIVQIFDLGKIDKSYYIAMEYVHGRDLRSIMKRARDRGLRIPMDLSVLIVGEVCSALEYAHRKKDSRNRPLRIVHRDVSPQNILISYEGDVKLTDFGIAKAAARATTTDRGALRGKLLYMSPEQAYGKSMDCRSDVFSLGIVFYEMITDQRPFIASSEKSILEMVRECRIVPPSTINSRVPAKLEKIIMRALAKDPTERYQDASDLQKDLERFLRERQSLTPAEIARFMEVLFDEKDRGAVISDEPTSGSGEHRALVGSELEMEFEPDPVDADEDAPAPHPPAVPENGTPVQSLLKKFGLK